MTDKDDCGKWADNSGKGVGEKWETMRRMEEEEDEEQEEVEDGKIMMGR